VSPRDRFRRLLAIVGDPIFYVAIPVRFGLA
jgi:hypothetical protein